MCPTRTSLKADLALVGEALLCLSLFGPQPLAWTLLTERLAADAGVRLIVVIACTVAGIVVTLAAARALEELRWRTLERAGRRVRHDALTVLVVVLAGALGVIAFVWFFFAGGYAPHAIVPA